MDKTQWNIVRAWNHFLFANAERFTLCRLCEVSVKFRQLEINSHSNVRPMSAAFMSLLLTFCV